MLAESAIQSKPREGNDQVFAGRVPALDVVRGFAAALIFVYHFLALCPLPADSLNPELRRIVTNYFGMGVPLFYALSAVSLYIGFFERRDSPGFIADFYRRRLFRIAPLFYCATIAWVGIFLYRGASFDFEKFLATVSFTFNLVPAWHESYVAAGWSIGVEMIFYVLFPCVLLSARSLPTATITWIAGIALSIVGFASLAKSLPGQGYPNLAFISHLGFFATGILAYFVSRNLRISRLRQTSNLVALAALLVLLAASLYLLTGGLWNFPTLAPSQPVARMLWSIPIGLLILIACRAPADSPLLRPLVALGNWSYSLYLLHPLVLYFAFEPIRAAKSSAPTAEPISYWLLFAYSTAALLLISYLSFRYVEQPFIRLARAKSAKTKGNAGHDDSAKGIKEPLVG